MKFKIPLPEVQISFCQRLEELKKSILQEALLETLEKANISKIDEELSQSVSNEDLKTLATNGLRGEIVFPVPYLLKLNPKLLSYYRLLLGLPQKSFYSGERGLGFGIFKNMETKGTLSKEQEEALEDLCAALIHSASLLLQSIKQSPISQQLFRDLTLLTLGAQLRGGRNNDLGIAATRMIFDMIKKIVTKSIIKETENSITVKNAAGRLITIQFASDPDIIILETFESGKVVNRIAIEIKGGTDSANAHNRLGEAEKSHQKAKNDGFIECWTLIGAQVDLKMAKKESPTTNKFYYIQDLVDNESQQYKDFVESIMSLVGI